MYNYRQPKACNYTWREEALEMLEQVDKYNESTEIVNVVEENHGNPEE